MQAITGGECPSYGKTPFSPEVFIALVPVKLFGIQTSLSCALAFSSPGSSSCGNTKNLSWGKHSAENFRRARLTDSLTSPFAVSHR